VDMHLGLLQDPTSVRIENALQAMIESLLGIQQNRDRLFVCFVEHRYSPPAPLSEIRRAPGPLDCGFRDA